MWGRLLLDLRLRLLGKSFLFFDFDCLKSYLTRKPAITDDAYRDCDCERDNDNGAAYYDHKDPVLANPALH